MADSAENPDLKGGHPPAVKAGGMRITQNKPGAEEPPAPMTPEEKQEQAPKKVEPGAVFVSGALSQGDKDFPPEAVKSYHEKPHPVHDKRPAHQPRQVISQPRKQ